MQSTGQEAGRPQPQTTVESGAGPFIRHAQPGRAPQYVVSGSALGSVITQPLVARPGYFRNLRVTHTFVTGGTITSGTLQADAPYNVNSLIQLKDAFGTPLIVADGFSVANLLSLYSGGFGTGVTTSNVPSALSSWTTVSNTTGSGQFAYALPLEFAKGYGVLSAANASLLPTLQFNLNSAASIFGSGSSGSYPTITTTVDSDFYWLPEGVAVEPPGLGTTRQWIQQQLNPTVPSAASARLQLPRLGGYLDTLVFIMRDSTGARVDAWPSRLQLYVDGVPLLDTTAATTVGGSTTYQGELFDDMNIAFGTTPAQRPTGVIAISRKTSMSQASLGLLDTGETYLSTNPGTLVELNGAPWGSITNAPATVTALIGQVVPTGAIIQGLPEV
jgi:hypothetical protein